MSETNKPLRRLSDGLQIFENERFGKIRVVMKDSEPWFVAKDVCDCLEIGNSSDAISRLDEDEKGVVLNDTPGGTQNHSIISEPGLYSLVLGSRKPEAKEFKRWVTHDILPSLRKHGVVGSNEAIITRIMTDHEFVSGLVTTLHTLAEKAQAAERKIAILSHVNKTYTATEIAKELEFPSAIVFNKFLAKEKVQFKVNGTWELYSDYAGLGLVEIKQEVLDSGHVIYHRRWAQLGREWLLERYGKKGSNPFATLGGAHQLTTQGVDTIRTLNDSNGLRVVK